MKKITDVLVVGELNIDLILDALDSFPEIGKEKRAGSMTYTLGSSSAIFAANLSVLGTRVAFLGKIGKDDFGNKVLADLKKSGVDTSFILRDETVKTGITVILNQGEHRAMVTYPGAMEHLSSDEITDEDLLKANHLHISSIFLQPALKKNISSLLKRAQSLGLTTSLDPQWDPAEQWDLDLSSVSEHLDLFFPNEQEFFHLTGADSIKEGARQLSDSCVLVIKQSNKGATLVKKGEIMKAEAIVNDSPTDVIGAGDSFNAGFIFKYIQTEPLEECLKFANITGAVSTTGAGGTAAIHSFEQVMGVAKENLGFEET